MKLTSICGPCMPKSFNLSFSTTPAVARTVTWNGMRWMEYQITKSCQLEAEGISPQCMVWLCGGGAKGRQFAPNPNLMYQTGGGGAFWTQVNDIGLSGIYTVTIGAGGTNQTGGGNTTTFGSYTAAGPTTGQNAKDGGSGGGGRGDSKLGTVLGPGTGIGTTSFPFGDTVNHYAHCAGGGAGGQYSYDSDPVDNITATYKGGNGGSNGSNGGVGANTSFGGGTGGDRGGGAGGTGGYSSTAGSAATFYGSGGGGGGGYRHLNSSTANYAAGGNGYQGIVIIRVPAEALGL